jgi:hypothetical protein
MASKEAEFCADLKNVQMSRVWQKGKKNFTEKLILMDFENFEKSVF